MTDDRDHDEELAIRMMCGEQEALREVLEIHLEPVRELLIGTYGATVQRPEIDEAVNLAIHRMWKNAHRYDKTRGTLGGWFFTIAQRAVIDIFRREHRHRRRFALIDPEYDQAVDCSDEDDEQDEPLTKEEKQEYAELKYAVEHKLKGNQKIIIQADLAAGGTADAASLAELLNTTKDSIYVSRHKAHEKIRKDMLERQQRRESLRGKK